MAQFGIQYAERTPNIQSTAAPMIADTAAPYRALAQAGQAIQEIGEDQLIRSQKRAEEERVNRIYTETENGKIALSEFDAETDSVLRDITDPDEIQKISIERMKKRSELYRSFSTLPESEQALDIYTRKTAVGQIDSIDELRYERQKEKGYIAFDVRYQALAKEGRFDLLAEKAKYAYDNNIITEKEYTDRLNQIPKIQHDWDVESIRTLSQDLVGTDGDKTKAYAAINKAQEQGLITANDNKILGDSLDNYVSGRFHRENQAKYTAKVETYKTFIDKMQERTLGYEDIGNSTLSIDDQGKWGEYIKYQYDEPPTESTYKGFNKAAEIVFKSMSKQIGDEAAFDNLLSERYIEKSISDQQFYWAVDKIKKPLPGDVSTDLQTVFDDTRKLYGISRRNQAAAVAANKSLFMWVDQRIKEGKTPTAKEMYAKARWYKSGFKSPYDIGDFEVRGGVIYTVIDYDEDGQPIFEVE